MRGLALMALMCEKKPVGSLEPTIGGSGTGTVEERPASGSWDWTRVIV